ncbi:hypothetical protein TcasGA2_TC015147 [Tribolium castaneum]|uniref:Uncharacterized protein n=1 Tax=Tribolium castaneum TaxID=7070 RepID=D2A5M3_TRICA|nr:hypothetical protein TcasGA2_TC015147 [Tribolium castaneum]
MEDYGVKGTGRVIRAPSLKRGKTEERITNRVSLVLLVAYFCVSYLSVKVNTL